MSHRFLITLTAILATTAIFIALSLSQPAHTPGGSYTIDSWPSAYFPQMVRVYRDPNGANAVSLMTWTQFAAANVATVLYALIVSSDRVVAGVFGLNALGCVVVVGPTAIERIKFKHHAAALRIAEPDRTMVFQRAELTRLRRSWLSD